MTEPESEVWVDAAGLRPSVRPWLVAGMINVAVAALLLGVPYFRGPRRAADVPGRFSAFAACFYHSEALDDPGLGLPVGERGRYASLVLGGDADWPARCGPALEAIAPEPSIFLFPSIKNAEEQVRAAVALMRTEMEAVGRRRQAQDARVSDRPMRAMARLRGALAELGLAVSSEALSAERDAISLHGDLDGPPGRPISSVVPLRVGEGRTWHLAVDDGALLVGATDMRAVVYLRVEDGAVEQRLSRRPRRVRGMIGVAQQQPWLLFTTSPSRCEQLPDGCADRALGLTALLENRQTLRPMMWLRAHPLVAPERAVHIEGEVAHVLALGDEGATAQVREFLLVEPEVPAMGETHEPTRIQPARRWNLDLGEEPSVRWIHLGWRDGGPLGLLFAARGGQAGLMRLDPPEDPPVPASIERWPGPRGRHPEVASCGPWQVMVSEVEGVVRRADGSPVAIESRIEPAEAASLRVVCRGASVEVWTLADRVLSRARCDAGGCSSPEPQVEDVVAFDARAFDTDRDGGAEEFASFVATTDDRQDGVVWLRRFEGHDAQPSAATVPSPCWSDPPGGLCGAPRLASDGHMLVVATRVEENLNVVMTEDGQTFLNLAGLEQH